MTTMSRHPGETTEQWSSRAAAEYRDAREAANAHRRRIANTGLADVEAVDRSATAGAAAGSS